MKPKRYWAITYISGRGVMPDTIRPTKREAMKACCDNNYQFRENGEDWAKEWDGWQKAGCKPVRLTVIFDDQP